MTCEYASLSAFKPPLQGFKRMLLRFIPIILTIFLFYPLIAFCQEDHDTLTVAVSSFPPCVIVEGDEFNGFDIDIWEAIAKDLRLNFKYYPVEFEDIFNELISGRADVALSGITINAERERIIDFSQHYLDSGLRIMIPSALKTSLLQSVRPFFTSKIIQVISILIAFIFLCGQIVWLSERGKDAINDKYFPGIFESFWFVITTMTTVGYGDIAPRRWIGRAAAFLVMLTGIGLFGWIVGEFAAFTTVQRLQSSINSPEDLRGKSVATIRATTSVKTLKDFGALVVEVLRPEEAYSKLLNGEVDAVVYDSPNLLYYASNGGVGKVTIVGDLFDQQYYGIAFPEGSPLREKINRTLLKLKEKKYGTSTYDIIYRKWFGLH